MVISVSDPRAIGSLSDFLRSRINALVEQRTANELDISLLGSYSNPAMAKEIGVAIGEWRADGQPAGCHVELSFA